MKHEIALAGRAFDGEEEYAARLCEWLEAYLAAARARRAAQGPVRKRISECIARAKAARGKCPACGSGDVVPLDGGGAISKYGDNVMIDIAPDMWLCQDCKESFRIEDTE